MPKVPSLDTFQVGDTGLPAARVSTGVTPDQASFGSRQMVQAGQAVQQGASGFMREVNQQVQAANQLRIDDAINQRNEVKLRMLYDQKEGLVNIKGIDALQRPDGKPLADEFRDKYLSEISKIEDGLGNEAQKQLFRENSAKDITDFYGVAIKHENEQFTEHALSVRKGTIANRINEIGIRYNDPVAVDNAILSIKASAANEARMLGKSAAEAEAYTRELTSKAHTTAIMAALENKNARYADMYMKKYAGDMEANDILRVNGALTKELDAQIASETVNAVVQEAAPKLQTNDIDRAFNVAVRQESGGQQFDKTGKPLTSRAGAIGIAQVMPATGPEAAKLAGLPWDENKYKTDKDYNYAIGKAYFAQQLKEFNGNLPQAYAAYNAGPGATKEALAKAKTAGEPANWLAYTPKETQDYVAINMKRYGAGDGQNQRPSLFEMQNAVRERIGNEHPERLKMALDAVEGEYKRMDAAIKQQGEEAKANAMRMLLANGGRFSDLPASVRGAVPVEEVGHVMDFAKKLATGDDAATDWALYYQLKANSSQLGDVNLMAFRNKLSDSEFKQLVEAQNDVRSGKGDTLSKTRSTKEVLDQFMREVNIDPSPKDNDQDGAAKVGKIWSLFEQRVRDRERLSGKPLNSAELRDEAARMFTSVDVAGAVYGTNEMPYAKAMAEGEKIKIPDAAREEIVRELKAANLKVTDNVIELMYMRKKGLAR